MNESSNVRHGRLWRPALIGPLLVSAGCSSPFWFPENDIIGPPLARLQQIETVQLEDQSAAEPLTINEAAEKAIDELMQRAAPPESMDVSLADVRNTSTHVGIQGIPVISNRRWGRYSRS